MSRIIMPIITLSLIIRKDLFNRERVELVLYSLMWNYVNKTNAFADYSKLKNVIFLKCLLLSVWCSSPRAPSTKAFAYILPKFRKPNMERLRSFIIRCRSRPFLLSIRLHFVKVSWSDYVTTAFVHYSLQKSSIFVVQLKCIKVTSECNF